MVFVLRNFVYNTPSMPKRCRRVWDRDFIAAKMTADQIAEAQRLAREWDAAHPESRGLVLLIRSRIQRSEAGLDLAPLRT